MKKGSFTATITKREDFTAELFVLKLDLGGKREQFRFNAGQYSTVGLVNAYGRWLLDSGGKPMLRPYSIVSSPHEHEIELFVELVPYDHGGNLTPLLYYLHVGDKVEVLPKPKGVLAFDSKFRNQVMVSTVTGVAPFISMLREYFDWLKGDVVMAHSFYILHGASYWNEFVYDREFYRFIYEWNKLAYANKIALDFEYVPTVSRPYEFENSSWSGEKGRVNVILPDYLENAGLDPRDTVVYVCGHPGMIEDVKKLLDPRGWSLELGNLKEERFWK